MGVIEHEEGSLGVIEPEEGPLGVIEPGEAVEDSWVFLGEE